MARLNNMSAMDALATYLDTLRDLGYTPDEVKGALIFYASPMPAQPPLSPPATGNVGATAETAQESADRYAAAKMPPHEPTIAVGELLDDFVDEDREWAWDAITAYADIHARAYLDSVAALPPPGRGMVPMTPDEVLDRAATFGFGFGRMAKDYSDAVALEPGTRFSSAEGIPPEVFIQFIRSIAAHGIKEGS